MAHLTKKKLLQRAKNNRLRGFNGFNTGTRTLKSAKDYQRIKRFSEVDYE